MGFRVRKSIKVCKGVKINLSKSGISTSVKVGNVTHNSKRGTTVNIGHGISYHTGKTVHKKFKAKSKKIYKNDNMNISENPWDKMTNKQIKIYNIVLKTLLWILAVMCLVLAIVMPISIIFAIISGIIALKFDAKKMQSKSETSQAVSDIDDLSTLNQPALTEIDKKLKNIEQTYKIAYEYNKLAMQMEKEEDIDSAIENYEKSIQLNFKGNYPYDRLAILYRKRKDYDNEIRVLNKAIDLFEFLQMATEREDVAAKIEKFKTRLNRATELKNKSYK